MGNANFSKIIDSREFMFAIVDAEEKLVFGIDNNGNVVYGDSIPPQIKEILDKKVDVISGKSLIDAFFAESISIISNDEWTFAIIDAASNVLFGIRRSGDAEFAGIPNQFDERFKALESIKGDIVNFNYRSERSNITKTDNEYLQSSIGINSQFLGQLYPHRQLLMQTMLNELGVKMFRMDYPIPNVLTDRWDNILYHTKNISGKDNQFLCLFGLGDDSVNPYSSVDAMNNWKDAIRQCVRRYNGTTTFTPSDSSTPISYRIDHYSLGNEMDGNEESMRGMTFEQIANLVPIAYSIIKQENPNADLTLGGLIVNSNNVSYNYLDRLFSMSFDGGKKIWNFIDNFAFHYYDTDFSAEHVVSHINYVRKKMIAYNSVVDGKSLIDVPCWMTEMGCSSRYDETAAASRQTKVFLLTLSLGIEKVFRYRLRNSSQSPIGDLGLSYSDTCLDASGNLEINPNESYYAYKTLVEMLPDGSTTPTLQIEKGVYAACWKSPDNIKTWCVWCESEHNASIDIVGAGIVYDNLGNPITINNSGFTINDNPLYIKDAQMLQINII